MTAAVRIMQASKRFGATLALDRVDFDIAQGEFFGLLGPNGAGKTTLISALAGLVRLDSGRLEVMGCDVHDDCLAVRRQLGVVPQELVFDPFFTVRETLRMQAGYFGIRRGAARDAWIDELLEHLDLTSKADVNMRALSGGMKRRVLVAQALVHRPPVIVLDEPTAGVDVELRQTLWQFIKGLNREGHTIVLTTHYLEEAESMCDRIAMLKAGRVVALDTTRNLLAGSARRTLRLRTLADLSSMPGGGQMQGDGWWLFSLERFSEIEPLLARIRESGGEIVEMEINQPDLEEAFIRIMRGAGTD